MFLTAQSNGGMQTSDVDRVHVAHLLLQVGLLVQVFGATLLRQLASLLLRLVDDTGEELGSRCETASVRHALLASRAALTGSTSPKDPKAQKMTKSTNFVLNFSGNAYRSQGMAGAVGGEPGEGSVLTGEGVLEGPVG